MNLQLTINGQILSAERGHTILQAARAHGIYIPTLCDFPGLSSHGSCRMCIVEVEGKSQTPTACSTPIEEGMVVETDSAKIRELRGELLRMLLADHPGGCLFCPENRHCNECMVTVRKAGVTTGCRSCPADRQCELQELVERSGLQSVAYPVRYRSLRVEKGDPFYDRDYNLCILCERCIRVCETLHFTNVAACLYRGSDMRIGTGAGLSHLAAGCSFCGACVEACPTGTLMEKTRKWDGAPDGEVDSACPFCALGCEMRLESKDGLLIGSLPGENPGSLCVKGRFGVTETVNHPMRLRGVMRFDNGSPARSSWEEGFHLAAETLSVCDPQEFNMVVSASCSSEDLYVADKFCRQVMRSAGAPLLSAAARYGAGLGAVRRMAALSQPLDALDAADLVFCLGLDAKYAQSVVETRLKKAQARGASILTLNAGEHIPGRFADLWLRPLPGQEKELLETLIAGDGSGDFSEALRLLRAARAPLLVVGPDLLARIPDVLERLQTATGANLALLPAEGNLAGALRLGLGGAQDGPLPRVLYLLGVPIPEDLDQETFVIYQNTHAPEGQKQPHAGLLLPMAAFSETGGSLIDQGGRRKQMLPLVPPPGDALPGWEILCRIARALGHAGFDFVSTGEIGAEMAGLPEGQMGAVHPPRWLAAPGEHEYLGADLADWVEGLRVLPPFAREEAG